MSLAVESITSYIVSFEVELCEDQVVVSLARVAMSTTNWIAGTARLVGVYVVDGGLRLS